MPSSSSPCSSCAVRRLIDAFWTLPPTFSSLVLSSLCVFPPFRPAFSPSLSLTSSPPRAGWRTRRHPPAAQLYRRDWLVSLFTRSTRQSSLTNQHNVQGHPARLPPRVRHHPSPPRTHVQLCRFPRRTGRHGIPVRRWDPRDRGYLPPCPPPSLESPSRLRRTDSPACAMTRRGSCSNLLSYPCINAGRRLRKSAPSYEG